jgi:hypothetical protein
MAVLHPAEPASRVWFNGTVFMTKALFDRPRLEN